MTKLIFFKGLHEIGGTFAAIMTDKAVCYFDFGFTVSERADSLIRLRPGHIPQDYVRIGMLCAADGIYEEETARSLGVKAYGETDKACFFIISHMHIDHMGGLDMLSPDIPVYMSEDSLTLYRLLEANGELTYRGHKNCIGVPFDSAFSVEDIRVNVLSIDHDCRGAAGFLIETPDGTIAYTGDYRFHGFYPQWTQRYAAICQNVDVLITEATTLSFETVDMKTLSEPPEDMRTEEMLLHETTNLCRGDNELFIVNPYNRNVDRLHYLQACLRKVGRTLVLDAAQASYVHAFFPDDLLYIYNETMDGVDPVEGAEIVTRDMLLHKPQKYVLQLNYRDQYELFDLAGVVGGYIHMDGAPLGSYDPSYEKMRKQLGDLDIPYHYLSLGGHAYPYYVKWMVDTIAPKTLIPLHGERPEQVDSTKAKKRLLPMEGQTYILKNGILE